MPHDLSDQLLDELRWLRGLAVALAGGDAQMAEDLVQDGAVALLQQRGPVRSIRAWLATVVRRRAVVLRAKKAQPLETEPVGGDEGHEVAERLEAQQRLNAAVLKLPDPYRAVVVGHHLDGIALADLARQRGVPAATVRQQHKRALDMLRERLDQDPSEPSGQGWRAAIAPLLAAPAGLKTAGFAGAGAAATTGGIIMLKKLLAAGAVIVGAWWAWSLTSPEPALPPTNSGENTSIAAAAGEQVDEDSGADPQREAGGSTPTSAEPTREDLVLTVRGGDGAALARAIVHCGPNGQTSRFGMTDDSGKLRVQGWDQAGEAWVWARNRAPFRQILPTLRGEHSVVLPDGPVVEGLVTLDGKPPSEPIVLSVHWRDAAPRPELPHGWSGMGERVPTLETALTSGTKWGGWLHPDYDWRAIVVVEPGGRFTLRGARREELGKIHVGWSGWESIGPFRLMGPAGEPVGATYRVPDETQPIHIQLLRAPSLRATFVFADGEPVANGRMRVRTVLSNGKSNNHEGGLSDAQGRIHRALIPSETGGPRNWWREVDDLPSFASLELRISHPDAAPRPLRWQRTALRNGTRGRLIDLGEVVVPRVHRIVAQILAPEGRPLAGIQALLDDDLSKPTDATGRTTLELAERELRDLWVAGPGWSTQAAHKLGGRGTEDDPLRLRVTHQANRLVVSVPQQFSGDERHDLRFGLECSEPIFPATRRPNRERAWGPTGLHRAAEGSDFLSWSSGSANSPARVALEVSESREFVVVGIKPGLRVTAWLEDQIGQRILEQQGVAPDWGEEARIELHGEPSQSTHDVQVQLAGMPAAEGTVYCQIPGADSVQVDLDDSGQGQLQLHASGAAAELLVAANGAVMHRQAIQLTAGKHSVQVTLRPADPLTVALIDSDGAPVAGIVHLDSGSKAPWGVRELLGGAMLATRHVLANAPPGPTSVIVHLGARRFRRVVQRAVDSDEAKLVVPRPVEIALELPDGAVGQSIELRWQPEGHVVGETNTHAFTFAQDGWRPATVKLLPGRYQYTLHRRWRDAATAQGVVDVRAGTKQLRLNVAIPPSGR